MAAGNVLATSPFGVTLQQPGGQVLFLPPEAVPAQPDLLAPAAPTSSVQLTEEEKAAIAATGGTPPGSAPPLPAGAFSPEEAAALGATGGALPAGAPVPALGSLPVPAGAPPGFNALPPVAGAADLAAPPPAAPASVEAGPISVPGPSGTPAAGDAALSAAPIAGADPVPPIGDSPPPDVTEPPPSPQEAQELARLTQGVLAKDKADEENRLASERDALLKQADANAAEAVRRISERNEQLVSGYQAAIQAKADYNATQTKKARTDGHGKSGRLIALVMGALGDAFDRGGKGGRVQTVIEILNMRAEQEAKARTDEERKLQGAIEDQANLLNASTKQATGLTERGKIEKAAILEEYARQFESIGRKFGGEAELAKAREAAAALRIKAQEDARKAANDQQELERKEAELTQRKLEQRQDTALGYAKIAEDKAQREMTDKRQRELADADNKLRERDLAIKEADHQLKVDEKVGEKRMYGMPTVKLDDKGQPVQRPDGKGYVFERAPLINSDGKEWRPGTVDEAKEARATIGGSMKATQLIDKAQNLIARYGWSSDLIRSKEWQEVKSTFTEIQMARKGPHDLGLGVIAGPDMELLDNILGGDPTGVRDPTPSLRTARASILIGVNSKLTSLGYDGKEFSPAEVTDGGDRDAITDTEVQKAVKQAQGRSAVQSAGAGGALGPLDPELSAEDQARIRDARAFKSKDPTDLRAYPTKSNVSAYESMARIAAAKGDEESGAEAKLALRSIAERDTSPIKRQRAREVAEVYGIDLGVPDAKSIPPTPDAIADLAKKATGRGRKFSESAADGFKDLDPSDRARVKASAFDPRKEDADPTNFPTAAASDAINKLGGLAANEKKPWSERAAAARELRKLAKTAPTAMIRRRVKRMAAFWKVAIPGGDADEGGK